MMPNFTIERIAMTLLAIFLAISAAFYAGYSKGESAQKAEQAKIIAKQVTRIAERQAETHVEIKDAGENYAKKFKELETKFVKLGFDFGRLRIPTSCSLSKAGTDTRGSAETGSNKSIDGPGTGEINLDGIAAKTIELGADLDKSTAKIEYLQDLVVSYQKACMVH